MEAEQLEPSPVRRPYPGPGQAEVDVDDVGAVKLHQGDDAGVGGGVEEEGGEALRGGLQGSLDRGQEVGEVGEAVPPVVEGASECLGECRAGAGEEVREVSPGGGAGGEAAGSGLSRPVALEPVRPVTAAEHPRLDGGGAYGGGGGAAGGPQGVGAAAERDEGGAEEEEAGQGLRLGDQLAVPVGGDCAALCLSRPAWRLGGR